MAIDKAVDSGVLEQGLTKVANAIRDTTGDTDALSFPEGMVDSLSGASAAKLFRKKMIDYCKKNRYMLMTIKDGTTILKNQGYWEHRRYWTTMPDSVTKIEGGSSGCFEGCRNTLFDRLSNSLTSIGNSAFNGCTNLALTSLPDSLTSIGSSAFRGCANLALTSLSDSLTSIGNSAFNGCTNLALTSLPDSLTSIEDSAFNGCANLALTSLSDSLTSIGDYAFNGCTNLALTSLSDSLTSIGISAFNSCTNLALTSLPDSLTSIGDSAFYYCNYLCVTEIPASVKAIGVRAFHKAFNSSSQLGYKGVLTFKGTPDSIGDNAFYYDNSLKTINVPWAEGAVAGAPWGFSGTINYNYTGG